MSDAPASEPEPAPEPKPHRSTTQGRTPTGKFADETGAETELMRIIRQTLARSARLHFKALYRRFTNAGGKL